MKTFVLLPVTAVVVAVVTDNGAILLLFVECGGAMTDGDTDVAADVCNVLIPFICNLPTKLAAVSSFKLTDKRFASNVLIILLNDG